MPIPFIIIAGIIVFAIISASKKQQEAEARARQQRLAEEAKRQAAAQPAEGEPTPQMRQSSTATDAERARRQEELKRRLQENAARREAEKRVSGSMAAAPAQQRRPLEKRVMQTALQKEKPTVAHSDDDCGGGSIHDGYHEGVTQFKADRPVAVAGNLGHRLADEDERAEREAAAAESAKRAMARIGKLPPLAQGMIYSEILGKPKSETA